VGVRGEEATGSRVAGRGAKPFQSRDVQAADAGQDGDRVGGVRPQFRPSMAASSPSASTHRSCRESCPRRGSGRLCSGVARSGLRRIRSRTHLGGSAGCAAQAIVDVLGPGPVPVSASRNHLSAPSYPYRVTAPARVRAVIRPPRPAPPTIRVTSNPPGSVPYLRLCWERFRSGKSLPAPEPHASMRDA
jgi:hypothetical protein